MAQEPAHVELLEFKKENIPYMNWMFEDLFCLYGTSIPFFLLDFEFPTYAQVPDEFTGYEFNLDWGPWGQWLVWFNELLGLLFDEAHLPRWQMPDFSDASWSMFNDYITSVYDNIQRHDWYSQSGTFTKDEVVEGDDSGVTGYYKWKDGDDHIYIATKRDSSGVAVADYDEEKVIGQTSGTYAYTYIPEPVTIYSETAGKVGARRYTWEVSKNGLFYHETIEEAWEDHDAQDATGGEEVSYTGGDLITMNIPTNGYPNYNPGDILTRIICLLFDTSSVSPGADTITLRLYIHQVGDSFETPTLQIYRIDEEFTTDHYDNPGTFVCEGDVLHEEEGEYHEVSLSSEDINFDGTTRLVLRVKQMVGDDRPNNEDSAPCSSGMMFFMGSGCQIKFEY